MRLTKFFALGLFLAACTLIGNDIATFKGAKISVKDFKAAIDKLGPQADRIKNDPSMRERFLDHLINQKLILAKAKGEKYQDSKEFKEKMSSIREEVLASSYMEHFINRETTDAKAKKYFEENPAMFSKEEVKASHILVKEEAKAQELLAKALKPKADFAALAKKHSIEPGADKSGGNLNYFGRGAMVPEFEKAAFSTKKGAIHPELVKTQFGFHIIKVEDRRGDDKAPAFASVKEEVVNRMKRNLSKTFMEDLRKVAEVKVDEKKLKELKL